MKGQLLTFLFCVSFLQIVAQTSNAQRGSNSFIPVDSAKFRINFTPFAFGFFSILAILGIISFNLLLNSTNRVSFVFILSGRHDSNGHRKCGCRVGPLRGSGGESS